MKYIVRLLSKLIIIILFSVCLIPTKIVNSNDLPPDDSLISLGFASDGIYFTFDDLNHWEVNHFYLNHADITELIRDSVSAGSIRIIEGEGIFSLVFDYNSEFFNGMDEVILSVETISGDYRSYVFDIGEINFKSYPGPVPLKISQKCGKYSCAEGDFPTVWYVNKPNTLKLKITNRGGDYSYWPRSYQVWLKRTQYVTVTDWYSSGSVPLGENSITFSNTFWFNKTNWAIDTGKFWWKVKGWAETPSVTKWSETYETEKVNFVIKKAS